MSTTARLLALAAARAAVVDVDDVRQLIVSGAATPWQGAEGLAQQRLGVENACDLAGRFHAAGFDVIVADVLTPLTLASKRQWLPRSHPQAACLASGSQAKTSHPDRPPHPCRVRPESRARP